MNSVCIALVQSFWILVNLQGTSFHIPLQRLIQSVAFICDVNVFPESHYVNKTCRSTHAKACKSTHRILWTVYKYIISHRRMQYNSVTSVRDCTCSSSYLFEVGIAINCNVHLQNPSDHDNANNAVWCARVNWLLSKIIWVKFSGLVTQNTAAGKRLNMWSNLAHM